MRDVHAGPGCLCFSRGTPPRTRRRVRVMASTLSLMLSLTASSARAWRGVTKLRHCRRRTGDIGDTGAAGGGHTGVAAGERVIRVE